MNKIIPIILISTILLSFPSCGKKNDKSIENTDIQLNGWRYVRLNDSYLYYGDNSTPSILDYNTMETSVLCTNPSCSHKESDCLAKALLSPLQLPVIYNNSAYYFSSNTSTYEEDDLIKLNLESQIMKYDFENMTTTVFASINGGLITECNGSCLIGSEYFFTTTDCDPKYDELGNVYAYGSPSGRGRLYSVNLDSGKISDYGDVFDYDKLNEECTDLNSPNTYIIGEIGSNLYLCLEYVENNPTFEEMQNGASPEFLSKIFSFNIKTKEIKQIDNRKLLNVGGNYYLSLKEERLDVTNIPFQTLITDVTTNEVIDGPEVVAFNDTMILDDKVWFESKIFDIETQKTVTFSDLEYAVAVAIFEKDYIIQGINNEGNTVFEKIPVEEIDKLFKD